MNTNNSTKLSADQRVDEVINNIGRGEFWDFEKIKQKFIEAMEEYASQQREDEGVTEDKKEVILQMYKGLTALRLEVDGSIVDELIQRFKKVESLLNAGEPMAQKEDQDIEKLAEDILERFANDHSYENWPEMVYDSHDNIVIDYTKQAMVEMYNLGKSASQPIPPSKIN